MDIGHHYAVTINFYVLYLYLFLYIAVFYF